MLSEEGRRGGRLEKEDETEEGGTDYQSEEVAGSISPLTKGKKERERERERF